MKKLLIKDKLQKLASKSSRYQVLAFLLSILLCIFIYQQLSQSPHAPFPETKAGKYLGKIVNLNESPLYFKLQSVKDKSPLVVVYNSGSGASDAVNWSPGKPLLLKSESFFLRFTESKECVGYNYCGAVTNLKNGKHGRWYLKSESIQPEMEEEKNSLQGRASFLSKKVRAEAMRIALDSIKQESKKLAAALEDAESIKSKSETRFSSQQLRISELKLQIDTEESALRQLQANFEIAKSVSPRGRVTSLARQILSREFDLLTPTSIDAEKLNLIEKARVAREVLSLKKQVEDY